MTKEPSNTAVQEIFELSSKENAVLDGCAERLAGVVSEEAVVVPRKGDSHIGKEEDVLDGSKCVSLSSKKPSSKRKFSFSDAPLPGSESDEDSVRTSSSQRSHEVKVSASSEKDKDLRKSSTLKTEELTKSSSRSKSDRDDKYSSYSRSERDSKYSSSRSRYDRDRRRSRSRSHSRSERGSRTSSSYSRSERSHYYDIERRYHRSSPYRERVRYSRSYVDSRARESSDSEEEYRRTYSRSTDSRRTSSHSSYRDSRTSSYSKSERDSKVESSHTDSERRGKPTKPDRESKRTSESEVSKRCSPVSELRHRRGTSHSKADSSVSSSLHKSTSLKTSAPKFEKFRSSFCCAESKEVREESNCIDSEASSVPSCERKTAVTQQLETERTVSPSSLLTDSPTFKKLDGSKEGSPISKLDELAGINSHDSIKDAEVLVKGRHDQLIHCSPIEQNVNWSLEDKPRHSALCSSEVEEIVLSSDESLDRSEVPPHIKSPVLNKLPSNGFLSTSLSKGQNLDDPPVLSSESNSLLKEKPEDSVLPEYEFVPSCTVTVNNSKSLTEKVEAIADPCNTTKDPAPCYLSDEATLSLYYSEIEIEANPSDSKVAQQPFMVVHLEPPNDASAEHQNSPTLIHDSEKRVRRFNLLEGSLVRESSTEECFEETQLDSQSVPQQPPSQMALERALPKRELPLECPEMALELDVQYVDSVSEKVKSPLKKEHSYYLEIPVEDSEKEERDEEEESAAVEEGPTCDLEASAREEEKGDGSWVGSAFSDAFSPSCDIVVTVEETETITEEAQCDSNGSSPELSPLHNEDDSDTADSATEPCSEESDTEGSDSDDSSVPRNRLQSVVVIPKNSTLTMEESSSCSSRTSHSHRRYMDHREDTRLESSKPFYEKMPEAMDSPNGPQHESKSFSSGDVAGCLATFPELNRPESKDFLPDPFQPQQSDGVDSTSQSELASDSVSKPNPDERTGLNEPMFIARSIDRPQEEELHRLSKNFEMATNASRQQANVSKPDSRQGKSGLGDLSDTGDYSREDGFHSTEHVGCLGWDFSQPEKPSSTYQQPDSSYGVFQGYVYPPASAPFIGSHNYWHDNGYWDPRLSSRPSEMNYERLQGQVPDSLTEDHEEYEEVDCWVDESQSYFTPQSNHFQPRDPREKGSVQAHEISSNSAKEPTSINERKELLAKTLDKNDMKERGPLKKRRQELETESESDGDSRERKKVKTDDEQLPVMPQDSSVVRPLCIMEDFRDPQRWKEFAKQGEMPYYFDLIEENVYLTER